MSEAARFSFAERLQSERDEKQARSVIIEKLGTRLATLEPDWKNVVHGITTDFDPELISTLKTLEIGHIVSRNREEELQVTISGDEAMRLKTMIARTIAD